MSDELFIVRLRVIMLSQLLLFVKLNVAVLLDVVYVNPSIHVCKNRQQSECQLLNQIG